MTGQIAVRTGVKVPFSQKVNEVEIPYNMIRTRNLQKTPEDVS